MLEALVLPSVRVLEVKGDEGEEEALKALQAVRVVMDRTGRWTSGVGELSLGETWTGQLVWLDAEFDEGKCRIEWRASDGFELVKVGAVILETLRVEVVKSLSCRRWPRTSTGTADEWRRLWRATGTLHQVSIDNGTGEDALWDDLAQCLLLDSMEKNFAWPMLTCVRLIGVYAYDLMQIWFDWLHTRAEKGMMLEKWMMSAKLVESTDRPNWDSDEDSWGDWVPQGPVRDEEWRRRFEGVARHVHWHSCVGSWGNPCLKCGSQ